MGKFQKLKAFAVDYTQSFILIIVGACGIPIAAIAEFHGIGQWDGILMSRFMWGSCTDNIGFYESLIDSGYWRFAEVPFQDSILFRSSAGNGYDFFLMLIAVGWALVFVSAILLMLGVALFYRQKSMRLRFVL